MSMKMLARMAAQHIGNDVRQTLPRRRIRSVVATGFVVILQFGCGSDLTEPTIADLRTAPEVAVLGQNVFTLEIGIGRDFSPVVPSEGPPLMARLTLLERDSLAMPQAVELNRAWFLRDDGEVWSPHLEPEQAFTPEPFSLVRLARDGPKWEVGINVSVVVEVVDGTATVLLQAKDNEIGRVR